jgi:hypothetical protein
MVGEVLDRAMLGPSVMPTRQPIQQGDNPDDGNDTGKKQDRVGHSSCSATISANASAVAHNARPASSSLHDALGSPTKNPMTTAPAMIFATSGTLLASTARCSGFNRSIVVAAATSSARSVPAPLAGIFRRYAIERVLFCHPRAVRVWQFLNPHHGQTNRRIAI